MNTELDNNDPCLNHTGLHFISGFIVFWNIYQATATFRLNVETMAANA